MTEIHVLPPDETPSSATIAALLREIAGYLELDRDRFRARAYDRAARSVEGVANLERLVADRRLGELPGIGPSLAGLIEQLVRTGSVSLLEKLRDRWPRALADLSRMRGVGRERARRLHEALAPHTIEEVAQMCEAGRVRALPGFGRATEARILAAIRERASEHGLLTLERAAALSASLARMVGALRGVQAVEVCGAVRRWMETADRVELAVASTEPPASLADTLRSQAMFATVDVQASAVVARAVDGVVCEIQVAEPARFGAAQVHATGSSAHLAALAAHAASRAMSFEAIDAADEHAFYRALGLPWLPPEVRDGTDEIAAALAGDDFTDLVRLDDLRGAVHCHTTYSDGKASIAEMAGAAAERGLDYLTITDHSQSAGYAGGLSTARLREQWAEIEAVQRRTPVRLLRGSEVDILADGALDYPMGVIGELDVVIASIHKRHKLDEDGMTRRLAAAIRQPVFKIWGHALGRIVLHRDPIPCRFDELLDVIEASPVAIEINGDPRRLDLEPGLARRVRARHAAAFVLSSDAHSTRSLDNLAAAVGIARRARIRRQEVLNTLPADEFARLVRPHPPGE